MKKIVCSTFDLSTKQFSYWTSTNWKIWVGNSVFAIVHIENRKRFTEVLPPRDQTNPFAYSSFPFHTSYKNGMICHGGDGGGKRCRNAQNFFYKNLLETYFVKNCR